MSSFIIVKNAADAKDRTVTVEMAVADYSEPWDGTVTGIKPLASVNGATPDPLDTDIVKIAPGVVQCILTQAESNAFALSDNVDIWVAADTGRAKSTTAHAKVFAVAPTGTPQTVPSAAEIVAAMTAETKRLLPTIARGGTNGNGTLTVDGEPFDIATNPGAMPIVGITEPV